METGGKAEVREFDVTQRVNEDVIGFNVTMDETKIMHSLNSQDTFGHVELGDVLRESVVFDEPIYGQLKLYISFWSLHSHQVTTGEEFHDKVKILRVLERVVQLHDPRGITLGKDVPFSSNMRKLSPHKLSDQIIKN